MDLAAEFDRIAMLDESAGAYDDWILRQLPARCGRVLEIGCGTGQLTRRLAARAEQVTAIDLSPKMIERARAAGGDNIDYRVADAVAWPFPDREMDCAVSLATLHHLPFETTLTAMARSLRPGGLMLVHDLFRDESVADHFLAGLALAARLPRRIFARRPSAEARAAWAVHAKSDHFLSLPEVRRRATVALPCARVVRHLQWRYTILWISSPSSRSRR